MKNAALHFAPSTAIVAVILLGPLPYVAVRQLWTTDLTDRIGCVALVFFLAAFGIGAAVHALRGKPLSEIGD